VKVGDLVIVHVPVGTRHASNLRTIYSTQGIVIEMKKIPRHPDGRPECEKWWYVLRSDTGRVEKFHSKWMEPVPEAIEQEINELAMSFADSC